MMLDGDLYVDRNGVKYTTCPGAADDDPWYGALILTQGVVDRLREEGLLPLTEVVRPKWADEMEARKNRWWNKRPWRNGLRSGLKHRPRKG